MNIRRLSAALVFMISGCADRSDWKMLFRSNDGYMFFFALLSYFIGGILIIKPPSLSRWKRSLQRILIGAFIALLFGNLIAWFYAQGTDRGDTASDILVAFSYMFVLLAIIVNHEWYEIKK
ncbi:MAG: hypothetical protein M0042_15065 [Nitrospiraceae bacterium]|nr:hypothetical protein [Nitrospiraceae bacterium]